MCDTIKWLSDGEEYKLYIIAVYLPQQGCIIYYFKEGLDILKEVISACLRDGEIIIVGDTNWHFGEVVDIRWWVETTANARHLLIVCGSYRLKMADIGRKGEGPTHTFC